jgi:phage gpG-like protein
MADELSGLGALISRVGQLATDTRHVERPLKAAGAYQLGSIEKNFRAQGRPTKWEGLKASTLAGRRRGRGKGSPQILINTARLKNSFSFRVLSEGVEVGTNLIYAARQHFGYPGGSGRGHSHTPARPFLMVQDPEDINEIQEIFKRHLKF